MLFTLYMFNCTRNTTFQLLLRTCNYLSYRLAIAYSIEQTIKSVCVRQSVSLSVCVHLGLVVWRSG